jgi:hypothetical protein
MKMLKTRETQHKTLTGTTLAGYHVFYAKSRGQAKNFFCGYCPLESQEMDDVLLGFPTVMGSPSKLQNGCRL